MFRNPLSNFFNRLFWVAQVGRREEKERVQPRKQRIVLHSLRERKGVVTVTDTHTYTFLFEIYREMG